MLFLDFTQVPLVEDDVLRAIAEKMPGCMLKNYYGTTMRCCGEPDQRKDPRTEMRVCEDEEES